MTQVLFRGGVVWLLAGGLAACATAPSYPIGAPNAQAPAAAPPPASPSQPPPPANNEPEPRSPPVPPPQAVGSQPLGPTGPSGSAYSAPPPAPRPPPTRPETRYVATGKVVPAGRMFRDYRVQKGDHLDEIARDLETTRQALVEANHLKAPYALRPGQHLRLPVEKAYVFQRGDTLAAVALRFGISPGELADLNALSSGEKPRPGEQLALPSVIHDRGPVPYQAVTAASGRFGAPRGYETGEGGGASSFPRPLPAEPETASAPTDAQITAAGRGRFVWPLRGQILSPFGVKDVDRRNDGIDIKAPLGTPVLAAAAGDVVYAGDQVPGFGNLVLIKHADGWVTAYAYLGKVNVKMRQSVAQNEAIGEVGQTGGVAEPQLHFEVRYAPSPLQRARPIDPQLVLPN